MTDTLTFSAYLDEEWRPALGCTEPACVAYAAAVASEQASGAVESVSVVCDPRMYKNCFAVGIPHSGHKMGLRWAVALGSMLTEPDARLEILRHVTPATVAAAGALLESGRVHADVDTTKRELYVDCTVRRSGGVGRAVIASDHTCLVRVERDGEPVCSAVADRGPRAACVRAHLAGMSVTEMIEFARTRTTSDLTRLREGAEMNMAMARHGLSLLPERFMTDHHETVPVLAGRLVCAGVYARMCGEDLTVMSLAGSGNKGITVSAPLVLRGEELGAAPAQVEESLALACLLTSATTHHLGALSAVCGCSNAAGIGLAAGLTHLEGGDACAVSGAITNMVGNVAGMICDGAKIGCALKTMSSVDAAFRAASLALSGVAIPPTDGIVGVDGLTSLRNLGRIAVSGMAAMDGEILGILRAKMLGTADVAPRRRRA